jgi:hypothetical protein
MTPSRFDFAQREGFCDARALVLSAVEGRSSLGEPRREVRHSAKLQTGRTKMTCRHKIGEPFRVSGTGRGQFEHGLRHEAFDFRQIFKPDPHERK